MRRALTLAAIAQLGPAVLFGVVAAANPPGSASGLSDRLSALVFPAIVLAISGPLLLWVHRTRPSVWPWSAASTGGVVGLLAGIHLWLESDLDSSLPMATAPVSGAVLVALLAGLGGLAARRIAVAHGATEPTPPGASPITGPVIGPGEHRAPTPRHVPHETLSQDDVTRVRITLHRTLDHLLADYRNAAGDAGTARATLRRFQTTTVAAFRTGERVNVTGRERTRLARTARRLDRRITRALSDG